MQCRIVLERRRVSVCVLNSMVGKSDLATWCDDVLRLKVECECERHTSLSLLPNMRRSGFMCNYRPLTVLTLQRTACQKPTLSLYSHFSHWTWLMRSLPAKHSHSFRSGRCWQHKQQVTQPKQSMYVVYLLFRNFICLSPNQVRILIVRFS